MVKNDILLFTESWSNEQFNYEVPHLKHFILHRQNKSVTAKRDSGGIGVYVHERLCKYVEFMKNNEDNIIWLK